MATTAHVLKRMNGVRVSLAGIGFAVLGCAHGESPDFDIRRDSLAVDQVIEIKQKVGLPDPRSVIFSVNGFRIYARATSLASALGEASSGKAPRAMLRRLLDRQPVREPFSATELAHPKRKKSDIEVLERIYPYLLRSGRVWIFVDETEEQIETVLFTKVALQGSGFVSLRAYTQSDRVILETIYARR